MADWHAYLAEHRGRFLEEAVDLMRIPSVSTLPEHAGDVRVAADWVAARIRAAGIDDVRVVPTGGHPVVLGQWLHAPGKPTVLVYGHFDTQPADPVEQWSTPPFDPVIRNGRIYARGASDDKGNMLAPILAAEAVLATAGALPLNVKFLFEGEEEIGSPSLARFIEQHRDALACDLVLSADGSQYAEDRPQLILSCRGLARAELRVRGPSADLHSGLYGGAVQNPISALAHLLSTMRAADGRVTIDGFYDDVRPLSDAERRSLASLPFDEGEYERRTGAPPVGESGYTTLERIGFRPSLDVNGISGGFQGEGVKTVIPAEARAKLSFRLVADQDPARIVALLEDHVRRHAPPGVDAEVAAGGSRASPYRVPPSHGSVAAAAGVLSDLYGVEPYRVFAGASLPICGLFLRGLRAYTLFFGFALEDENMHAPNEFLRVVSFERAQEAYAALLARLGDLHAHELGGVGSVST